MYATHILLSLIATVSAIDVYGYRSNEKCSGNDYIVCRNVNPEVCCTRASGDVFKSIGFRAIPTNWNIYVTQSNGAENICCGGSNYSGGNYGFVTKKRSDGTCAAAGGCASVARGDLTVFENGPEFDMTGLDDALYTELVSTPVIHVSIWENGGSADEIPSKFDAYKLE
ncbi:hypothetical protein BDP81DRAFT_409454 [Colletotrichum phormii]|uniref:Secreted protein n=1 Tax=Colletotrichum phormii TaxID=359342 RepID=A0AAJ0EBI9_9PEZI|nr:uncharacterized protein BDP81DRAFT_409454 [Colletotrichum phormii]KAK1625125.1 hypothetical protein BDP81DRAFT_409454 [Colletotrichum phormii]